MIILIGENKREIDTRRTPQETIHMNYRRAKEDPT